MGFFCLSLTHKHRHTNQPTATHTVKGRKSLTEQILWGAIKHFMKNSSKCTKFSCMTNVNACMAFYETSLILYYSNTVKSHCPSHSIMKKNRICPTGEFCCSIKSIFSKSGAVAWMNYINS